LTSKEFDKWTDLNVDSADTSEIIQVDEEGDELLIPC